MSSDFAVSLGRPQLRGPTRPCVDDSKACAEAAVADEPSNRGVGLFVTRQAKLYGRPLDSQRTQQLQVALDHMLCRRLDELGVQPGAEFAPFELAMCEPEPPFCPGEPGGDRAFG